jgi:RHS repeat-associated protein
MGQRIAKIVKDRTGGTPSDRSHWRTTWYVRDASGNVMSTYEEETEENSEAECPAGTYDYTTTIAWAEAHIYGSSRVGMETQAAVASRFGVNYDSNDQPTYAASNCISFAATAVYSQKYGDKRFELSNHLGNVLVVVSDLLIANTGTPLSYSSEVISATDYYPYGMVMDERNYQQMASGAYRYSFNGQETQTEITGSSSHMSAEFWMYDTRIGRRWNVDPKPIVSFSPFACFTNNPLLFSDPLGDIIDIEGSLFFRIRINLGITLIKVFSGKEIRASIKALQDHKTHVVKIMDNLPPNGSRNNPKFQAAKLKDNIITEANEPEGTGDGYIFLYRKASRNRRHAIIGSDGMWIKYTEKRALANELSHAVENSNTGTLDKSIVTFEFPSGKVEEIERTEITSNIMENRSTILRQDRETNVEIGATLDSPGERRQFVRTMNKYLSKQSSEEQNEFIKAKENGTSAEKRAVSFIKVLYLKNNDNENKE